MISSNMRTPGVAPQVRLAAGGTPTVVKESELNLRDGVTLAGPLALIGVEQAAAPVPANHGKLGETGLTSALQSLPPEGNAAAQWLNSKAEMAVPPMTEHQREVCIQGLETLNLAGYLKSLDPATLEHQNCTVAEALANMANGASVFYRDGKQGPLTEIGGLEKLTAVAEKARYRIVG